MTTLERAARALFAELNDLTDEREIAAGWENVKPEGKSAFRGDVRAVLTAIREPSEEMVHVGLRAPNYVRGCAAMFTAMIDALLSEAP